MNPHLIERLAQERFRERLRRAELDRRIRAGSRQRIVRPSFDPLSAIASLLRRRRQDPGPSASCCA